MSERVRVAVVDDQYLARGFFEGLVRMSERYELAASIPCAEQAITFCDQNPVDLVVMDVMMKHGLDGLTCARSIKASHPEVKIILTTSTAEAEWIEKARRARVESFWFKEYSSTSLTEVMDRTMDGESVYPDSLPNPEFGFARKADLTEREQEVLRELTRNYTNEEIAQQLHISVNTVRNHIQHMLEKTGYKNRIDLAVNAKALGVVVHEDDRTENRTTKGGNRA
ncbi:MAG: response regulator transcription factor [Clostridia bacterium]|nr:response regulator transcription factor [Clostridia bacterium]